MPPAPLHDWQFTVDICGPDRGWSVHVQGSQRWTWGPFASEADAQDAEHRIFQRWLSAARDRGGWAWRRTAAIWVVTAPADVDVHGEPLCREACSLHHAD